MRSESRVGGGAEREESEREGRREGGGGDERKDGERERGREGRREEGREKKGDRVILEDCW